MIIEKEILASQNWWENHGKFMGRQDSSFWITKQNEILVALTEPQSLAVFRTLINCQGDKL